VSGPEPDFPHPVFIGGFGRSGTHAIGPIVGADPRYHLVETEVRFHAVKGGLPDVLEGTIEPEQFVQNCWEKFWMRGFKRPQGVHRLIAKEDFERALADFTSGFADDRWEAGRRLLKSVCDPTTERAGKPAWCELTGRSVVFAPTLLRLFPRVRFLNIVRDGRAIAGGHVQKIDMTDEPLEALEKWDRMIRASHAGMNAVPPEHVLKIKLDDLVYHDREGTLRKVADFLEVEDPGPMREFMDRRITPRKAHVGKWRTRMPPPEARKVDRRYRRMVREFRRDGIDWVPDPEPRELPWRRGRQPVEA
jgi:hypothetical protein